MSRGLAGRYYLRWRSAVYRGDEIPRRQRRGAAKKAVTAIGDTIEKQAAEQFTASQPASSSSSHIKSGYDRRIAQLCGQSDAATVAQARIEMFSADFRPQLGTIKCPILVLGALADKIQHRPRQMLEGNYKMLYVNAPQTRFKFFPDSRHYLMIDNPVDFYAALDEELAAQQGVRLGRLRARDLSPARVAVSDERERQSATAAINEPVRRCLKRLSLRKRLHLPPTRSLSF